jgi:cell division protein FtsQ
MKKINWKNVFVNVRLILIIVGLGALYSFTLERNGARKLVASKVVFMDSEARLISAEAVDKLLIENNSAAQSIRKDKLDLNRLEKSVGSNELVADAEVSVSISGVLTAEVRQKTPVVRYVGDDGSYYIDYDGNAMPLSEIYTARVPLVSGQLQAVSDEKLREVFRYIHDDEFLSKNIISIEVLSSGSLMMRSRNHDYLIEYGKPINVERKFSNYKAFFQKAAQDSIIEKYKRINLKFTQQVVCTK